MKEGKERQTNLKESSSKEKPMRNALDNKQHVDRLIPIKNNNFIKYK